MRYFPKNEAKILQQKGIDNVFITINVVCLAVIR